MKTLKRISALLLVLMLMASFSITAFAEDPSEIPEPVPSDKTIHDNPSGNTIETNNGTVETNHGDVTNNNGSIYESLGSISENNGTVGKLGDDGKPDPNYTNFGTILNNNDGATVVTNDGTITNNNDGATVVTNIGRITNNNDGATVVTNNRTIENNYATVETNKGTIEYNAANATVETNDGDVDRNYGTINTNNKDGEIFNNNYCVTDNYGHIKINDGIITNNYGTDGDPLGLNLQTSGKIENNGGTVYIETDHKPLYQGYIENNFGGTIIDTSLTGGGQAVPDPVQEGYVVNQFSYNVDIKTENASASDKPEGDLKLFNDLYWLKDGTTAGGSVTVSPISGYAIKQVDLDNSIGTAVKEGNGWKLTINSLTGNIVLFIKGEKIPVPAPNPAAPVVVAYKLKFDLGGGVMPDGKTELELKCSAGQKITLPEAPTREGFTFVGWQTTVRGNTVILDAGAKFTVTAAKTFVALWEEN